MGDLSLQDSSLRKDLDPPPVALLSKAVSIPI